VLLRMILNNEHKAKYQVYTWASIYQKGYRAI
jgi:hypothetical protein